MFSSHPTAVMKQASISDISDLVITFELMFAATNNDLRQFAERLINQRFSNPVIRTLEEEDQNQLRYVKMSMQQKMPKELQSKKYQTLPTAAEQNMNNVFPRMFQQTVKKAYEYINDDMENIRKIAQTFMNFPITETSNEAEQNIEESGDKQKAGNAAEQAKDVQQNAPVSQTSEPKEKEQEKNEQRIGTKSHKSRPASAQPKTQPALIGFPPSRLFEPSRVNPFIANNMNFMDPNANSKSLQAKYQHMQLNQNSRNIAAMTQASKFSAFSQSSSFPTSVMPGTILAPRETSFSKEAKLDIGDVLRYTLGVKRQSDTKTMPQNPFHRPPKRNG